MQEVPFFKRVNREESVPDFGNGSTVPPLLARTKALNHCAASAITFADRAGRNASRMLAESEDLPFDSS